MGREVKHRQTHPLMRGVARRFDPSVSSYGCVDAEWDDADGFELEMKERFDKERGTF